MESGRKGTNFLGNRCFKMCYIFVCDTKILFQVKYNGVFFVVKWRERDVL